MTESKRERPMQFTLIIPVYNGEATFPDTLRSIQQQDHLHFTVLVVDDASTDTSSQLAEAAGAQVLRLAHNSGPKFKAVSDAGFVPEQYGLVVKKGNAELLARLNQGLAAIRADGSLARIHAQYFGAAPQAR